MAAPKPWGLYIHVPFCSSRCGYCDFNTYTPGELGSSASPESYLAALEIELALIAQTPRSGPLAPGGKFFTPGAPELPGPLLGEVPIATIFCGGGTPSLLGAAGLGRIMQSVRANFTLLPGAEVTTESNPESTSPEFFSGLLESGFTRVSLGMQSAAPKVLQMLERRHTPGRAVAAARQARAAGFSHVNLDLIYGTPVETDADLERSLDAVLSAEVDHVSAYSLIVEEGTALARKVRRGEIPAPDEEILASRYERIDARLQQAGFEWYEVSNWAQRGGECQHNLLYWRDADWWGAGPGAHSHFGNFRFANRKHPARYATQLSAGQLPLQSWEELSPAERQLERLMLGLRLKEGLALSELPPGVLQAAAPHLQRGLLKQTADRLELTAAGRLLADGIITDLSLGI